MDELAAEVMRHRKLVEGAVDSQVQTLARESAQPKVLGFPRVRPDDPAGDVVLAALRGAVSRISASDPDARRGDVEGIHRLRTSTRRLRSELRALEDLVDRHWREPLEDELKWLAGLLGRVRDLDILMARLQAAATPKPGEAVEVAIAPLLTSLQARHALAARALADGLQSDRYRTLLSALQQSLDHPALTDAAWGRCSIALPPVAAAAWRRLKKGARALRPSDPVEEFHELRKRAKQARYTAELIAPVLGPNVAHSASRFIRLTTKIQGVLGEHQDATVSIHEIECALEEHRGNAAFTDAARRLLNDEQIAARKARTEFFTVWEKLDRKKTRRWIKLKPTAKARAGA